MKKDRFVGLIVLKATLLLESNTSIGSGESHNTDHDVIKYRNKAYLTSSSVSAAIKKTFKKQLFEEHIIKEEALPATEQAKTFHQFWGTKDEHDKPFQSHIKIGNSFPINKETPIIEIIDGIALDPKTNQVKKGAKYDYEVVTAGQKFDFIAEIKIHQSFDFEVFEQYSEFCLTLLKEASLSVGANTSNGMGIIKAIDDEMFVFDFRNKNALGHSALFKEYLRNGVLPSQRIKKCLPVLKYKKPNRFIIKADFSLKGNFITGQEIFQKGLPDKQQLQRKRNGITEYYLLGQAINGAIKHRMFKILNTLGHTDPETYLKDLFGFVKDKKAKKSRVLKNEPVFEKVSSTQTTRIKIDRFSGATMDTALQSSIKINGNPEHSDSITIKLEVKDTVDKDVFFLLQVFKDLYTGDCPIGADKSIGSGLLMGKRLYANKDKEILDINETKSIIPDYYRNLNYENIQ